MSKAFVVVLGEAGPEVQATAVAGARMAGAEARFEPSLERFAEDVGPERPLAAIVSMDGAGAREVAVGMRMACPSLEIPLIGLCDEPGDLSYEEAFAAGMDDVCALDARRLGRRLRNLADVGPVAPEPGHKTVVIVDDDCTMRALAGRLFRDAGYAVQFASDADEALQRACDPAIDVVVCASAIHSHDEPLSGRAAAHGSRAAWIINTPPKQIASVRSRLGLGADVKVAVHDAFQSPATLLFVANELLNRPAVDGRKSERLLYGAKVLFRHAGRDDVESGYLYNISGGGVYVRTLAPPQRWDEMWLEFVPPRSDRLVHLEGTAVWTRPFGPGGNATVPCGFGVQITGGSRSDMVRYGRSYETYLAERVAQRSILSEPCAGGSEMDLPTLSRAAMSSAFSA